MLYAIYSSYHDAIGSKRYDDLDVAIKAAKEVTAKYTEKGKKQFCGHNFCKVVRIAQ